MLKKIIYFCGIISLIIVIVLNFLFTANLDSSENISIKFNSFIYIMGLIVIGILLFVGAKIFNNYLYDEDTNKQKEKIRKYLFIGSFIIYILFNIIWIMAVRPPIIGDTGFVCDLAETFFNGDLNAFLPNTIYANITRGMYMQGYHQQIPLAFIFSICFRIINFPIRELLRIVNVISNIFIVIAIYKINKHLSKKYNTNKILLLIFILTFISLPMLSTFVYGDIPSLALCLFSVYFMMKYIENKEVKYAIFSSICMMIAYMMRMNSLIFIIATVMYLLMNLAKEFTKKDLREKILNLLIIGFFIVISIIPSKFVINYYLGKCNLEKDKSYPSESYFLMAMEESRRGNGWYNEEIAEYALENVDISKEEYRQRIKDRLKYFSENLGEGFEFYTMKLVSMWAENTYSAINVNTVGGYDELENIHVGLQFYQKVLLILTCLCSLIVLIQNRKDISLDVIFLLTIFIGGFAFHILWEAKSRYIIPYLIILIPIACISIKQIVTNNKNSISQN